MDDSALNEVDVETTLIEVMLFMLIRQDIDTYFIHMTEEPHGN